MPIRPRSGRSRVVRHRKSCAGMLEADDLAALRIDAGHDVLDGAVLPRRVHRLEDHQDGVPVGGIKQLLLGAQPRDVFR